MHSLSSSYPLPRLPHSNGFHPCMNVLGQGYIIGLCWNLKTQYSRDKLFYHNQGMGRVPQVPPTPTLKQLR